MDTIHTIEDTIEEESAAAVTVPEPPRRSARFRRVGALAVVTLTIMATLGLSSGTASAATFSAPVLDCTSNYVRVDPGVRSYGTSDGFYQIQLWKYVNGWRRVGDPHNGWTSANQIATPHVQFSGYGSGAFAATVERWNFQNGRWVRLPRAIAETVDYRQRLTGVIVCQLW